MLALYAVCVYPANIKHALNDLNVPPIPSSWWYHGPRLAFQPVFVWWALFAAGIVDWPFHPPARPIHRRRKTDPRGDLGRRGHIVVSERHGAAQLSGYILIDVPDGPFEGGGRERSGLEVFRLEPPGTTSPAWLGLRR